MFLNNYYAMKHNQLRVYTDYPATSTYSVCRVLSPLQSITLLDGSLVAPSPMDSLGSCTLNNPVNRPALYNVTNTATNLEVSEGSYTFNTYTRYIRFGSGTTPETLNDYNIENQITTLRVVDVSVTPTEGGHTVTMYMQNTSADNISISEICFLGGFFGYSTYGSSSGTRRNGHIVALYRKVFAPVTIPGEAYFTFTYSLTEGADTVSLEV